MPPLPKKWAWLGGLLTVSAFVVNHQTEISAIPGNTPKAVVSVATGVAALGGLALAMLGHSVTATSDDAPH